MRKSFLLVASSLLLFACSSSPTTGSSTDSSGPPNDKGSPSGKADAWDFANDPSRVSNEEFEYNVDKLPRQGEMDHLPIPGDYWATYHDSINYDWQNWGDDPDNGPAAKYAKAFGLDPTAFRKAVSKKYGLLSRDFTKCPAGATNFGCEDEKDPSATCSTLPEDYRTSSDEGDDKGGVCVPSWWGICHGWSPYALTEKMAVKPVEKNGVTFYPGDLNALLSLLYTDIPTDFISRRCNKSAKADEIEYDEDGRAIQSECRDMNPGSLYVIAANMLGIEHKGFVVDRTWDSQVWNQPVRGFEVTKFEEVTAEKAQQLVTGKKFEKLIDSKQIAKDQTMAGSFDATKDGKLALFLTGTGDADLYVKVGEAPTTDSYDCRPYNATSNETCKLDVKSGDKIFWMVSGWADDSTVSLSQGAGSDSENVYAFNDHAERFFNVTMALKWITEGGPRKEISDPKSFVDEHTRTDRYTFVLECDKDGNIIGGEYTGHSKKFHTDFLWIPKGTPANLKVGEFTIEYDKVRELNEAAAATE